VLRCLQEVTLHPNQLEGVGLAGSVVIAASRLLWAGHLPSVSTQSLCPTARCEGRMQFCSAACAAGRSYTVSVAAVCVHWCVYELVGCGDSEGLGRQLRPGRLECQQLFS
jgi:hypothetical protein